MTGTVAQYVGRKRCTNYGVGVHFITGLLTTIITPLYSGGYKLCLREEGNYGSGGGSSVSLVTDVQCLGTDTGRA